MALAACLFLDAQSDRAVRTLWDRLEEVGVPTLRSHTHRRHLPHLSLAVLRQWRLDDVRHAVEDLPLATLPVLAAAVYDGEAVEITSEDVEWTYDLAIGDAGGYVTERRSGAARCWMSWCAGVAIVVSTAPTRRTGADRFDEEDKSCPRPAVVRAQARSRRIRGGSR